MREVSIRLTYADTTGQQHPQQVLFGLSRLEDQNKHVWLPDAEGVFWCGSVHAYQTTPTHMVVYDKPCYLQYTQNY